MESRAVSDAIQPSFSLSARIITIHLSPAALCGELTCRGDVQTDINLSAISGRHSGSQKKGRNHRVRTPIHAHATRARGRCRCAPVPSLFPRISFSHFTQIWRAIEAKGKLDRIRRNNSANLKAILRTKVWTSRSRWPSLSSSLPPWPAWLFAPSYSCVSTRTLYANPPSFLFIPSYFVRVFSSQLLYHASSAHEHINWF